MELAEILFLVLVMVSIVAVLWGVFIYEKKRTEELELVAQKLGFSFSKTGSVYTEDDYKKFKLFSQGRSKKIKNKIWKKDKHSDIAIFEYSYTTGSGKHSNTHRQTVLSIKSKDLNAPAFELKPENAMHKLGQLFGYQDIDFEAFPDFSKRYLLRGENVEKITRFFTPNLISFFEKINKCYIEVREGMFVFYLPSNRCRPGEIRGFYKNGDNVFKQLINN